MNYSTQDIEIKGNNAVDFKPYVGLPEIPVWNSRAVWEQNPNYPNNYTLIKTELKLGKKWGTDKTIYKQYGWTEQVMFGEHKDKIEARVPLLKEHEDDDEWESLGFFDEVSKAMEVIISKNNPLWGFYL